MLRMEKAILTFLFIIIGFVVTAQDVVREEFYTNGNLKLQFIKVNSDVVQATYYFETGEIREKGYYRNELLSGKWQTFNVDAELIASGFFVGNQKTGDWLYYKGGELFQIVSYSRGQLAAK